MYHILAAQGQADFPGIEAINDRDREISRPRQRNKLSPAVGEMTAQQILLGKDAPGAPPGRGPATAGNTQISAGRHGRTFVPFDSPGFSPPLRG